MSDKDGNHLLSAAKTGGFQEFSKLLTWLERSPAKNVLAVTELLNPSHYAFRFGITGPPGAGKSTLVGQIIKGLREQNFKVGVMAIDPSSPFSHGAVLGDRIRYSEHSLDSGVFIRSLGTRGSLGGLSSAAFLMARAFDECQFDILLIETVGVGQTELDVLHVADKVCVVLVPESGDAIQTMKAGLMEIADVFVVNKSDRPGAESLAREIQASQHDSATKSEVQVFQTVATEGKGAKPLIDMLVALKQSTDLKSLRNSSRRLQEEAKALLRKEMEAELDRRVMGLKSTSDLNRIFSI